MLPTVLRTLLHVLRQASRVGSRALDGVALLGLASCAEAAGITDRELQNRPAPVIQEQSFDYLGPSGGRSLVFAQFDDLGGARPLVDVVLELVDTSTPMEWAVIGLLFCSAVGIGFGLLPAIRAARLDPVEALRYE